MGIAKDSLSRIQTASGKKLGNRPAHLSRKRDKRPFDPLAAYDEHQIMLHNATAPPKEEQIMTDTLMLWGIDRQWIERTVVLTKKYVLLLNPEENTRNLPNYEPGRVMDIIALTDIDIIEQEEGANKTSEGLVKDKHNKRHNGSFSGASTHGSGHESHDGMTSRSRHFQGHGDGGASATLSGNKMETPHFIGGRRQGMGKERTNADENNKVMMGAVGGASQMGTRVLLESLEAVPTKANRTPRPVATGDEAGTRRLTPELQQLAGDELGTVKPQASFKKTHSRIRRTPSQHMKRRSSIQDVAQSFSGSSVGLGIAKKSGTESVQRTFGGDYKSSENVLADCTFVIQTGIETANAGKVYRLRCQTFHDAVKWMKAIDAACTQIDYEAFAGTHLKQIQLRTSVIYTSSPFQAFVILLIAANFAVNCVQTELMIEPGSPRDDFFSYIDIGFTVIFTVELSVNLFAHWWKPFWRDPYNVFDFFIVIASVIALAFNNVSSLKNVRLVRAFRLLRIFGRLKSLRLILLSLSRSLVPVASAFLVMLLVVSIYAIIGVGLFGETYPVTFGTFTASLFSMIQVVSGDGWATDFARPMVYPRTQEAMDNGEEVNWTEMPDITASTFFISAWIIVTLTLLQVVVAVMIDNFTASTLSEKQREMDLNKPRQEATTLDPLFAQLLRLNSLKDLKRMVTHIFRLIDETDKGAVNYHDCSEGFVKLPLVQKVVLSEADWDYLRNCCGMGSADELNAEQFETMLMVQLDLYVQRHIESQIVIHSKASEDTLSTILAALKHSLLHMEFARKIQSDGSHYKRSPSMDYRSDGPRTLSEYGGSVRNVMMGVSPGRIDVYKPERAPSGFFDMEALAEDKRREEGEDIENGYGSDDEGEAASPGRREGGTKMGNGSFKAETKTVHLRKKLPPALTEMDPQPRHKKTGSPDLAPKKKSEVASATSASSFSKRGKHSNNQQTSPLGVEIVEGVMTDLKKEGHGQHALLEEWMEAVGNGGSPARCVEGWNPHWSLVSQLGHGQEEEDGNDSSSPQRFDQDHHHGLSSGGIAGPGRTDSGESLPHGFVAVAEDSSASHWLEGGKHDPHTRGVGASGEKRGPAVVVADAQLRHVEESLKRHVDMRIDQLEARIAGMFESRLALLLDAVQKSASASAQRASTTPRPHTAKSPGAERGDRTTARPQYSWEKGSMTASEESREPARPSLSLNQSSWARTAGEGNGNGLLSSILGRSRPAEQEESSHSVLGAKSSI